MKIVFLKHFNNEMEARLAQNILKEQGIVAIVQSTKINGVAYSGGGFGGTDLSVAEKDLDKAKALLAE